MISTVAYQKPIRTFSQPQIQLHKPSREQRRPDRVLIAEHRDEVFARLAADLRKAGYTVFRASRADQVCHMYSYGQIELVLYNFQLPRENIWSKKLRLFDAYARIWLYVPNRATVDQADVSHLDWVIYYQGDLFHLADQIQQNLAELPSAWATTPLRCASGGPIRPCGASLRR